MKVPSASVEKWVNLGQDVALIWKLLRTGRKLYVCLLQVSLAQLTDVRIKHQRPSPLLDAELRRTAQKFSISFLDNYVKTVLF